MSTKISELEDANDQEIPGSFIPIVVEESDGTRKTKKTLASKIQSNEGSLIVKKFTTGPQTGEDLGFANDTTVEIRHNLSTTDLVVKILYRQTIEAEAQEVLKIVSVDSDTQNQKVGWLEEKYANDAVYIKLAEGHLKINEDETISVVDFSDTAFYEITIIGFAI